MNNIPLTYGNEGFKEIKDFLNQNYNETYTLSIYDMLQQSTVEIECSINDMLPIIMKIVNIEKDFPDWIGVNEISESYVVGMNLTRGHIHAPGIYEFVDGELKENKF